MDDGATVLFAWTGYARPASGGSRELAGGSTHVTDDGRYGWLNDAFAVVTGEVRPRADGDGTEVVVEVFGVAPE